MIEQPETPISIDQARKNGIAVGRNIAIYYTIAVTVWGFALGKSIFWFSILGLALGVLIGFVLVAPVVAKQTTHERAKEMAFAAGLSWGNYAIAIGVFGIIVWMVRVIFF